MGVPQINLSTIGYIGDKNIAYACMSRDCSPHFHVTNRKEKWDIRLNMDGSFNSIKKAGVVGRQNEDDFKDIESKAKEWVSEYYYIESPVLTYGDVAMMLWNSRY